MIRIDYQDSRPLYEQIADKFSQMVLYGVLQAGEQLPTVRQLAQELSINPNTIQRAYSELEKRGIAYAVKGRGNFITENTHQIQMHRIAELKKEAVHCMAQAYQLGAMQKELIHWVEEAVQEVKT